MQRIETSGDPFERGRQQGEAVRERALAWMMPALENLTGRFGIGSVAETIRRTEPDVTRWRQEMAELYPDGEAECAGNATGLGLDEPTYFTAFFSLRMAGTYSQCTTLGFRDAQGRPLLGKTDDLFPDGLGKNVLEFTRPSTGYRHVHFHFAGTIWSVAGMNETGFCFGMTGLRGPATDSPGLLSLAALHTLLPACATVAEAESLVRDLRLNFYGFSLLLGDAEGGLMLLEKTTAGMARLAPNPEGAFLHTNHILDPDFAAVNPPQVEPVGANGERRYQNARRLLPDLPRTEEGLRQFLANTSGDGAICQQGADGLHTDFGILFVPTEKRLTFWPGYPATAAPETLTMDTLFR
jgi:hypothetical protein